MKYNCPESQRHSTNETEQRVNKDGFFRRSSDSRLIQRFKCQICGKRFSRASFSLAKNQNKRRVNIQLYKLLSSGVSMRRCAKLLNVHRDTVRRKLIYLGEKATIENNLKRNRLNKVTHIQFDDLLTIEHTKLKPLSVTVAVDVDTRYILGAEVSQIAAFGLLSKISINKYGKRKSYLTKGITNLFESIKPILVDKVLIESDKNKLYLSPVKNNFPNSKHITYKGQKGSLVGYGELKRLKYDPLFPINHTMAMLRANINRLLRKTWCTTKLPGRLKLHLEIFINYHNKEISSVRA